MDDLRDRLLRLNANLSLGAVVPGEAVWLACDLLVAGHDTDAVAELAGESPKAAFADIVPLARRMLADFGIEPIDTSLAGWFLVRQIARKMIAGMIPAEVGANELWLLSPDCDYAAVLSMMLHPLDIWYGSLPHQRDEVAIRAEMIRLAHDVLRDAESRLS